MHNTRHTSPSLNPFLTALFALQAGMLAAGCGSTPAPEPAPPSAPEAAPAPVPPHADEASAKPGPNARFLDPELDVEAFVKIFEGESREIAAQRDALAAVVGLTAGEDVADVGAGTGLFLEPFAAAVGPEGRVYAVDISPRFIEHLDARIAEAGWTNVETVLCTEHSAGLQTASVDAIFVCDTYHHFGYPDQTLASLYDALRPGGRMVVVDFERVEGVSDEWVMNHVSKGKDVSRAEIEAAGFNFEAEHELEGLAQNYVLVFSRP